MAQTPRLIDGIVLTKFDTIDDKVNRAYVICIRVEGVTLVSFHLYTSRRVLYGFESLGPV